jgi:CrcB protein
VTNYLCVLVGGGVGSLVRYMVGRAILQSAPGAIFPWSTFTINVAGSFLIGLLMTLLVERLRLPHYWQLTCVVGFLGGFTTFSSFEYDAYLGTRAGHSGVALLYLVSSVVAGYAAVWLGSSVIPKS